MPMTVQKTTALRASRSVSPLRLAGLLLAFCLVLAGLVLAGPALAQRQTATFDVVADRSSYAPGEPVRLLALVKVDPGWHVNSEKPAQDYLIPTVFDLALPADFQSPVVSFPADKPFIFPFESDPVLVYDGDFRILAELILPPTQAAGVLVVDATLRYQSCDDKQCLPPTAVTRQIELHVGQSGEQVAADLFAQPLDLGGGRAASSHGSGSPGGSEVPGGSKSSLILMILLGVFGGLILNAMPCVLPVLSLKVFGLIKSSGLGRANLVAGALATTAGILVSFWLLAGAAIVAAHTGAAVGWGIQFQQPAFVAFLAVVIFFFSLNMWGLFEIQLPQGLARLGSAGAREGLGGHFLSGFFATLMATPCSAPFLGTAIGFALGQPALVVLLMFTAIGVGLALPYLLLAAVPKAARLLPKPGHWMVTFRRTMGFLLAGSAVWLFYVLSGQISAEHVAYVQLALIALALCVSMAQHAPRPSLRRVLASIGIVVFSAGAILLAAEAPAAATNSVAASDLIEWIAFDESEAKRLATDEDRLVFVDFTAKWCLTCKAVEKSVIETRAVADAFERYEVVAMKGDWTNRDDRITNFLARYDRAAVPFYILFRPDDDPHVFGEVLTQSSLLSVIEESAPTP